MSPPSPTTSLATRKKAGENFVIDNVYYDDELLPSQVFIKYFIIDDVFMIKRYSVFVKPIILSEF